MPNRLFVLLISIALFLAACQGTSQAQGKFPLAGTLPAVAIPTDTAKLAATSIQESTKTPVGQTTITKCTVVSRAPAPGPTEQSIFPPPGEKDWVRGPETAGVTFIEYSDFQ